MTALSKGEGDKRGERRTEIDRGAQQQYETVSNLLRSLSRERSRRRRTVTGAQFALHNNGKDTMSEPSQRRSLADTSLMPPRCETQIDVEDRSWNVSADFFNDTPACVKPQTTPTIMTWELLSTPDSSLTRIEQAENCIGE